MDGKANGASLIGERPGNGLADPPGRVGRELEAEAPVELLDGADQPEVPFLDQVQEGDASLRVVTRDRHHEPKIRLDQLRLGGLVSGVLAAGKLTLLLRGQEPAVTDRPHVQLERIVERRAVESLGRSGLFRFLRIGDVEPAGLGNDLEMRLGELEVGFGVGKSAGRHRPLYRRWLTQTGSPVRGRPRHRALTEGTCRSLIERVSSGRRRSNGRPAGPSGGVPRIKTMCGIAGYSLEPGAGIARTLAAQALLAGIAERGADAVGYAHRGPH